MDTQYIERALQQLVYRRRIRDIEPKRSPANLLVADLERHYRSRYISRKQLSVVSHSLLQPVESK